MRKLHKVNIWMYGITLVLYITVIGGLLAQILLGIGQVVMSIILLSRYSELTKKEKTHLNTYYALAGSYLILIFATAESMFINGYMIILFYMVIPMAIGGYFVYVTKLLSESNLEVTSADPDDIIDE